MVSGALIFSITVLVNSIVCMRIRERNPSGIILGNPAFRTFLALPEDLPDVYTKIRNGPLIPVLGPLCVVANYDYIVGWWHNGAFRSIFNSDGNIIMKSIRSGTTHIMRYQSPGNDPDQIYLSIEQAVRDRSRSPIRGRMN
ncbi:uncharacterized protein LOC117180679 [Belonocnema kinseyi]|uniref:uncharacterized protein LOC117180679 n=1 Tax=Belonocnema kinseyi TaxID=2817044 RepID=UPI00143E0B14|nr:uncharacterized protein LOC117180679 [Belonocnema kinseyi]